MYLFLAAKGHGKLCEVQTSRGKTNFEANIPHIFERQPDKKWTSTYLESPAAIKWMNQRIVDDAIASTSFAEYTASKEITSVGTVGCDEEISSLLIVANEVAEETHRDTEILVRPHFESIYVQSQRNMKDVNLLPIRLATTDVATIPKKLGSLSYISQPSSSSTYSTSWTSKNYPEYKVITLELSSSIASENYEKMHLLECFKNKCRVIITLQKLALRSRLYVGLTEYYF